jgi:bifunctional DNase/RNase
MTHDLICKVLETLGARLVAVVITNLVEATYFAELHLERQDEKFVLSCRPSDAVAVALRAGTSIYVDDELMAAEGLVLASDDEEDEDDGGDPDDLVDQFREFLDGIDPDDFVTE